MVHRLLYPDPATGQRRFTARAFRHEGYQSSDLAYTVTGHSARGARVHTGIALVTGSEPRQWLYPALTRGTDANLAYVFTSPSRPADPQPGTRSAPELGRYDHARRERAGYPAPPPSGAQPGRVDQREPIAVLADVLSRDGAEQSASAIRQRNLAPADHLAILHAIWAAETQAARHDRYRALVTAALPSGHRQPLSHQARWLFRTLHAAELDLVPPRSSAPPSSPVTWPDPATSPPSCSSPVSGIQADPHQERDHERQGSQQAMGLQKDFLRSSRRMMAPRAASSDTPLSLRAAVRTVADRVTISLTTSLHFHRSDTDTPR